MLSVFFFNDTATTEIYTLSLHDALPILAATSALSAACWDLPVVPVVPAPDRKSTRLNSSHTIISYAVFCLKKKSPGWRQHTRRLERPYRGEVGARECARRSSVAVCVASCCPSFYPPPHLLAFFFFNDTATTEIYTLSLHDALPIIRRPPRSTLFPYTTSSDLGGRRIIKTRQSEGRQRRECPGPDSQPRARSGA